MQGPLRGTIGPSMLRQGSAQALLRTGILGFGVDGRAVAEFLESQPEVKEVRVFDEKQSAISDQRSVTWGTTLEGVDLLFRSPGFPLTHSLMKEAKKRGIPVTSSTTYFLEHFPGKTVGITGSNGKTTCTALIAEMLRAEFGKESVEEGGNDRKPRLDLLKTSKPANQPFEALKGPQALNGQTSKLFVVLELSSFQLIDCPFSPNVAVVLNLTPNHLDWHASMEEYAEAKRQIVAHQKEDDTAVLNDADPIVKTFAQGLRSTVRWFDPLPTTNYQLLTTHFKSHPDTIRAAVTAARVLGVSEDRIRETLCTFPGVSHRIEFVREFEGVKWYNDSSCTTPESAIVACNAFPVGSLLLLLGGRDKGMDFSTLYEVIKERKVRVVPYGEMAPRFVQALARKSQIPNPKHQDFRATINLARAHAQPGDNVVLSPACASFDMFQNAKERGQIFSELVRAL